MSITEFLLAQIAEDEAVAVAAEPHEEWISVGKIEDGGMDTADGEHVARWSPARVMAECESKRRIIGMHPATRQIVETTTLADPEPTYEDAGWHVPPELYALAQPYADHPDYDPAWSLTRD